MRILRELAAWDGPRKLGNEPGGWEEEDGFGVTFKIQITIYAYKCQANLWISLKGRNLGARARAHVERFFVC